MNGPRRAGARRLPVLGQRTPFGAVATLIRRFAPPRARAAPAIDIRRAGEETSPRKNLWKP